MADINQAAENHPVHVQDWRVWADINYLDSPTEYREFLPSTAVQNAAMRADFLLLSECKRCSKGRGWITSVIALFAIALLAAYSLWVLAGLH